MRDRSVRGAAGILAAGIALSGLLGACTSGGAKPSAACGGFQLFIANRGTAPLDVHLNGVQALTAAPGEQTTVYQYGPGGVSAMPWTVEIIDPSTGAVLAKRDVTEASGDGGARIEIDAAQGAASPVVGDVQRARGC